MTPSAGPDTVGLVPSRACRNCVQIKVKCTPALESPDNVCQRCHRLGKACTTPAPVTRKQRAKSTRVKDLEQRVNHLTALVASTNSSQTRILDSESSPSREAPRQTSIQSSASTGRAASISCQGVRIDHENEAATTVHYVTDHPTLDSEPPPARTSSPVMHIAQMPGRRDGSQLRNKQFCPVYIGFDMESRLFEEFRNNMSKHFPFVIVDENVSADIFKSTKPFSYWACILAASHRDRTLHSRLHDEMLKAIGKRLFVAGDKSLDMLQGLLLMTAWCHNISHSNPQLMNLLHLVQALLADMGILKAIRVHEKIRIASDCAAFTHGKESTSVKLGLEEKRALLGFYCLSWKTALTYNRIDPMRHSHHIGSCCDSLKSTSNRQSDRLIVELVHLYEIVEKFFYVDTVSTNSFPMYRTLFLDEIRRFRHNLPSELKDNYMLELEILASSLCIVEPSYTIEYQSKIEHLNVFHNCIEIGNQLTEAVIQVPNEDFPNTTFLVTMAQVQLLIVFSRLSFFKSNSWDILYSCSNVKLDTILERLADKLTKINQLETERYPQHPTWRYITHAQKATHIKDWYKAKVAAETMAFHSAVDEMMPNNFTDNPFGSFDDPFWEDIMGNWNQF